MAKIDHEAAGATQEERTGVFDCVGGGGEAAPLSGKDRGAGDQWSVLID